MNTKSLRYKYMGLAAALATATVLNIPLVMADSSGVSATATPMVKPTPASIPAASTGQSTSKESEIRDNDEWLVLTGDLYIPVIDQLSQHLQAAQRYFDEKNNKAAAGEIRQGAEFLQKEVSGPGSEMDMVERTAAANSLIKLADEVEQGKVTSPGQLDMDFSQANRVDIEHQLVHLTAEKRAPFVEKPTVYFQRATEAFNNKDLAATVVEINKGVAFLKVEEAIATGSTKESLHYIINRLEELASQVSKGEVSTLDMLDKVFAQAHYLIAQHHQFKASEAIARDETKEAGYELRAATHHLEQALIRAGHKLEGDSTTEIKKLNTLADKLIAGDNTDAKEVNQALEKVNQELARLNKDISIQTPYEWVVVDQNTFIPVVDDLTRSLQVASQALVKQDYKLAAQKISEGATFIKAEETKLTDETAKTELKTVSTELEQLASKVEQGHLTKTEDLNTTLLKAYEADTTYHWSQVSGEQASGLMEWPITYLGEARIDFNKREYTAAADEIFKAIEFLKLEKGRASGTVQEDLQRSITDLGQVAQQVREEQLKSDTDLNNAFIRAYDALSNHHYQRATVAVEQNNLKEAGYELKAATLYLEQAQIYLNQQPAATLAALHNDLLKMADEIIAEKYPSTEALNQGLKQLGQEIEKIRQAIQQMTSSKY